MTSNEVVYNFKIKKVLSFLYNGNSTRDNIIYKRLKYRAKVVETTTFANAKTKVYYNAKHILLMLKLGNRAYLRLNYNYYLLDKSSKKILF